MRIIFPQALREIALFIMLLSGIAVSAQVVSSTPPLPVDSDPVIITFYADQGNQGLKDYSGEVYAHTGLITSNSSGGSDWKYASDWGDNSAKYKLTRVSPNTYTLDIGSSIRDYYGVPASEIIEQMAFVFRSHDNSLEGKDEGGKDIFVNVAQDKLSVLIHEPLNNSIHEKGATVQVKVDAIFNEQLELKVNGTTVETSTGQSITYDIVNVSLDEYKIEAIARNGSETETDEIHFFVKGDVVTEPMPAGLRRGVNVMDATTVNVVLFAPNKEYVYLVGDFNNWEPSNSAMMKKDGDYFWLTIDGLDQSQEYAYQFWISGGVKVADPYATKILDPWNDKYIPERIYPNLLAYPEGKTDEIVSVLTTADQTFNWEVADFVVPEPETLVVYEVLIRDFTHNQDIKTITDTISYLKRLGVNAIELMPFNEFEGNDSWGYNPSFYFATDKAYGTVEDYKTFIDECHKQGIAVIMDMVLNHSFGQSPFARMYLGEDGRPKDNPWYNTEHNMEEPAAQWGHDFNHESLETKALVDSVCSYWLKEYKVDGFRFDFTKGFTNTPYPAGDWASAYDADRIAILKRMASNIWQIKDDALIIFEHLSDNPEEKELSNHEQGILFWGNANHEFNQATMGYSGSDFSWASYQRRGWERPAIINYMESHDEERIMYKNQAYGNSSGDYDVKNLPTALQRTEAAAVFLMPIPGPKMIWQFGELGFDLSINRCTDGTVSDNCRLAQKPPKWEYMDDEDRMRLFTVYQQLIKMKVNEPVFSTNDFILDVTGNSKRIKLNMSGSDVRIIGNFGMEAAVIRPQFSTTGKWYSIFTQDSIQVTDVDMEVRLKPGEYMMYSQKRLSGFDSNTSTGDHLEKEEITFFPNPFSSTVTINSEATGASYELFSITGVVIEKGMLTGGSTTVNWGHLPNGHYLLKVNGKNGSVVKKMLKR
ncbi:alpha-amylase family glycosyl hydrolase [Carboxylicivirga sp. M1479]|uniref:alpha-amylase family glycosyl hydrolase n=1 Tax=Carboxylicivirga sp. M1479 TaxID=2594476 RepID=UPI0011782B49|nr:alpha-amylase family glycosyl hydrolase [Carboxylicivirga sp. M1479]TRX71580.1 T9SS type A sorting domain-containing protein [Carboxylicivirga sp. M1479]